MKVLHVLRQFNHGGIECWLERLLLAWPRDRRPEFHFALEEPDFGVLAPRMMSLGAHLHHCPPPRQTVRAASSLLSVLADYGPFQAIHCHNHHASVFNLALAAQLGVPIRASHSHADLRNSTASHSRFRRYYAGAARLAVRAVANVRLAVSKGAAADLFGETGYPVEFLPCGIDFQPYVAPGGHRDPSRFTLIHVGRLVPEKNHSFLFRVLKGLTQTEPNAQLWLVGDGPLRPVLEAEAAACGISDRVHFWGARNDIADLLSSADVFVFPSFSEGLGLAAIEAQAAGLPVVLASHLPTEIDVFPTRCIRLALDLPIEQWVISILNSRDLAPLALTQRLARLERSEFSIHSNVRSLSEVYANK